MGFSRGNPFLSNDDIDPNATRSLFVGNIPKNISIYELRDVFQRYGPILVRKLIAAFVLVYSCKLLYIIVQLQNTWSTFIF